MAAPIPQYILDLSPYVPGKLISEVMAEMGLSSVIKLGSNENNLGPSPKALEAMRAEFDGLARYGDAFAVALKNKIARKFNLPAANVVCGNGSSEFILLLCHALLGPGLEAVMSRPSFTLYAKCALATGAKATEIPLKELGHDLPRLLGAIGPQTRIVFLDNPLNPTGAFLPREELEAFSGSLPEGVLLALDEAYADYARAPRPDYARLLQGGRVVILRTFSKLYGLAGVRVAYALMDDSLAAALNKIRQPFNLNNFAQAGAIAALDDEEHERATLAMNAEGVAFYEKSLPPLGLKTYPTQANFIMADSGPLDAETLVARLFREGIIVRSLKSFGLNDKIRVTVGLPRENAALLDSLPRALA
ncbi:MAG: histidinol-phosphate transaminase [Deltaproteobacteria bacterium]|jgi:histidinol-phosphate aminotransferase|nr:histidinol-phosphate transaminase [Deltaproteobacteria bacterium]